MPDERDTEPNPSSSIEKRPSYRYGIALLLNLSLVVFVIVAPETGWSRAIALAISGAALIVSVSTARVRESTRRRNTLGAAIVVGLLLVIVATGAVSPEITAALIAVVTAATPIVIARGVVRQLK